MDLEAQHEFMHRQDPSLSFPSLESSVIEALHGLLTCQPHIRSALENLHEQRLAGWTDDALLLHELNHELLLASRALQRQDLFVLHALGFPRGGFFVDVGAASGTEGSNTHVLEKRFGWDGLLVEPDRHWHTALTESRAVRVDRRCAWSITGHTMLFDGAPPSCALPGSAQVRVSSATPEEPLSRPYEVDTISLVDLLDEHQVPRRIDYLSIATGGSELEILREFEFGRYDIRVITCHHGYCPTRGPLFELLSANGYVRKFEHLSDSSDWYVRQ